MNKEFFLFFTHCCLNKYEPIKKNINQTFLLFEECELYRNPCFFITDKYCKAKSDKNLFFELVNELKLKEKKITDLEKEKKELLKTNKELLKTSIDLILQLNVYQIKTLHDQISDKTNEIKQAIDWVEKKDKEVLDYIKRLDEKIKNKSQIYRETRVEPHFLPNNIRKIIIQSLLKRKFTQSNFR